MKMILTLTSLLALSACESSKPATPTVVAPAAPAGQAPPTAPVAPAAQIAPAAPALGAPSTTAQAGEPPLIPVGTKLKCPVSGEDFAVGSKTAQVVYGGKRYAFCCADCLPEFNKNPAKYAKR